MQYWRKALKYDTFFCILQTMSLGHVFVVALQGLFSNVIFEGLFKVFATFNVQLNVCGKLLPWLALADHECNEN